MNDELRSIKVQLCEMQGSKISNLIDELGSRKARATERRNTLLACSEKLDMKLTNFLGLLERKIECARPPGWLSMLVLCSPRKRGLKAPFSKG
jgi:hypothetical protein